MGESAAAPSASGGLQSTSCGPPVAESLTGACWRLRPADEDAQERLREGLGVGRVTARALVCRGISGVAEGRRFLGEDLAGLGDPFAMRDMDRALALVEGALERGAHIRIYGDYDVDGVCATALLVRALQGLGGTVDWYIPHRLDEGYGVNEEAVQQAKADGVELLITVDCGSTALEQVALARRLGMEVVVTDHHRPGKELPEAPLLNPWREDCGYGFKELAGVGVAFKLVGALARARGLPEGRELRFLDLVCLGTVGDVVPLLGENRLLVQHGLKQLANTRKVGLAALIEAARLGGRGPSGVARTGEPLGARQVAFGLAPRINAAGRMEHAEAAVRLLLTRDEAEARELAEWLSEQNERRREEERQTLQEAEEKLAAEVDLSRDRVIVLSSGAWHAGVIGIVASRLVERYHRPALLIAVRDGMGKGSGRSIAGMNLWEALSACGGLLTRFGGHHYAAGFGVREEQIGGLRQRMNEVAEIWLAMADLRRQCEIDAEAGAEELGLEAVSELNRLAPFGMGNPSPVVATPGLRVERVSRVGNGSHLSLWLRDEVARSASGRPPSRPSGLGTGGRTGGIWFGAGELEARLPVGAVVDVCHRPRVEEWNGALRVRLYVEDVAVREAPARGLPATGGRAGSPVGRTPEGRER